MSEEKIDDLTLGKALYLTIIKMVEKAYLTRLNDESKKGLYEAEKLLIRQMKSEQEVRERLDEVITQLASDAEEDHPDFSQELLQKVRS